MELKDYLRILRRRWLVTILVAAGFIGISQLYVTRQVRMYYATSEIIVKESPYPLYSEAFPALFQDYFTRATRIAMIKTRAVLWPAVLKLDKWFPDATRPGGVKDEDKLNTYASAITDWIRISEDKENSIVRIAFYDPNPQKVVEVVNAMAEAFFEYSTKLTERGVDNAITFMDKISEEREKKIKETQADLSKLGPRKTEVVTTVDLEMKQIIQMIEALRQSQNENDMAIQTATDEINIIDKALKEGQALSTPISLITTKSETIRNTVNQAETELEGLHKRYTDSHPQIVELKNRIAELKREQAKAEEQEYKQLELSGKFAGMKRLSELNTQRLALLGKKEKITKQIAEVEDHYNELNKKWREKRTPEEEKELKLESERLSLEGQLSFLRDTKRSAEDTKLKLLANKKLIASPVEKPDIVKEKDVRLFETPATKSLPMNILLGIIMGIATAFLLEYLNTSIRTEQDIRRYVNLPLMGIVLKIKETEQRLLMNLAPKSPLSEVFNTIGTLIQTYAVENKAKIFMIASSKAGEGKSTIVSNIAVALARGGERVLILDCDLRKAVLHKFFNVQNDKGVSNYLMSQIKSQEERIITKPGVMPTLPDGEGKMPTKITKIPGTHITRYEEEVPLEPILLDEIIKPTEVEGLNIVPAGPHPKNPVGLLKSDAFKELLADVKEKANIVLIDVPPVNIAVDTIVLSPLTDGIILLVSAGETNKDEVSYAKRLIESAKGKMLGCILNKVTIESRGYYYYYYYYYYYDSAKYYREV